MSCPLPAADAGQIRVITKTGHLQGNRFCFYQGATLRHQLILAPNIHTVSSNQLQSGHLLLPHGPSWIHIWATCIIVMNDLYCHGAKIGQNKAYSTTDKETQMRLCIYGERFIHKNNSCISLLVCLLVYLHDQTGYTTNNYLVSCRISSWESVWRIHRAVEHRT